VAIALAAVVVAQPETAAAQSTAHTARLGADLQLFSHESITETLDGSTGGFNVDKIEGSTTSWGPQQSVFGINFGAGLGDSFVVGGRIVIGGSTSKTNVTFDMGDTEPQSSPAHNSQLRIQLLPYLEYVFAPGSTVRTFLAATAGYGYDRSSVPIIIASNNSIDSNITRKASAAAFGAALGLHAFVAPNVSIDPELFFLYQVGRGSQGEGNGFDVSGITFGITLGISAWLGAKPQ
jgi:hypothetical protein